MALCCVRSATMKESITRPRTEQRERERKSCLSRFRCTLGRNEKKMEIVYDDEKTTMTHDDFQSQLKRAISSTRLISLLLCVLPFRLIHSPPMTNSSCVSSVQALFRAYYDSTADRPLQTILVRYHNFLQFAIISYYLWLLFLFFFSVDQLQRRAQARCVVEQLHGFNFAYQRSAVARERMAKPERCVKF